MNKLKNIAILVSLICGVSALVLSVKNSSIRTVYIDMGRIYEEFHLSIELNAELTKTVAVRKRMLDSLYENLRTETQKSEKLTTISKEAIDHLKKLEEEYLYKRSNIEKENQSQTEICNEKIWKQINSYVERYGKEMNYNYILGTTAQGNIMYGAKNNNVSDQLIEYINLHYDDKIR